MKRIEIGLTSGTFKKVEELAEAADLKPTELIRVGLRHTLADPQGFLRWLNGAKADAEQAVA